mgnify:CR=1 FL=1
MKESKLVKVVIGEECSVGGVGWSKRGTVVAFDDDVITMHDGVEVDRSGIDWVWAHDGLKTLRKSVRGKWEL